jgi:hypothetical protein
VLFDPEKCVVAVLFNADEVLFDAGVGTVEWDEEDKVEGVDAALVDDAADPVECDEDERVDAVAAAEVDWDVDWEAEDAADAVEAEVPEVGIVGEVPLEMAGAVFVAEVAAVGIVADVPAEVVASDAVEAEEDGDAPEVIDVELVEAVDGASDVGDSVAVVGEDASAAEVVREVGWMVVSGVVESVIVVGDCVSVVGDCVSVVWDGVPVVGDSVSVVGDSVSVVGDSVPVVISAAAVGIDV